MSDITIDNIYDYVDYDFRDSTLYITWNDNIKEIDKILCKERLPFKTKYEYYNDDYRFSCLWVEQLKRYISWKAGKRVKIRMMGILSGEMRIIVYDNPEYCLVYEEITEEGYLYIPVNIEFKDGFHYSLERCNCLYNDMLDYNYVLK